MNLVATVVVVVLGAAANLAFWSTAWGMGRVADTLFDALVQPGALVQGVVWALGPIVGA
jgi:hypothetical protein